MSMLIVSMPTDTRFDWLRACVNIIVCERAHVCVCLCSIQTDDTAAQSICASSSSSHCCFLVNVVSVSFDIEAKDSDSILLMEWLAMNIERLTRNLEQETLRLNETRTKLGKLERTLKDSVIVCVDFGLKQEQNAHQRCARIEEIDLHLWKILRGNSACD